VPPIRPVKGQLLHLRDPAGEERPSRDDALPTPGEPLVTRNIWGLEVYLVARADGRMVVGATVEERGFDTTVTAGAVHELLRAAIELVPDVAELQLTETVAGLRPGTPDNAPLLGPTGLPGLILATGHFRNGVLLTPVTAEVIAAYLTDGVLPDLARPFSPDRFSVTTPSLRPSLRPPLRQGLPA
jgi:glycine oxidase